MIGMAPLAFMVIVAGVYSSIESRMIDTWYSNLIDRQVEALRSMTEARAHTNRFGLYLYDLLAETDLDRKQVIDAELDKIRADYQARRRQQSGWVPSGQIKLGPPQLSSIEPQMTRALCVLRPWPATMKRR